MKTPLLTVPIQESYPKKIDTILKKEHPDVDVFEIWLDHLGKKHLDPENIESLAREWRKMTKKKLLYVCKKKKLKGKFPGTCTQLTDLLLPAANASADFFDLDVNTNKKQISRALKEKKKKTKLILSFHDFKKTPPLKRLVMLAEKMKELGADIIKIACFVNTLEENERLIQFAHDLKKIKWPHIIIGMGEQGIATRIFAHQLGNELSFVSLEKKTAPGQLTIQEMVRLRNILRK